MGNVINGSKVNSMDSNPSLMIPTKVMLNALIPWGHNVLV